MTKQEFLDRLRISLNGKILPGQVVENLQFYDDYINTEIRKGMSEAEVMTRLGDPRLIARTIVETQADGQSAEYGGGQYGSQYGSGQSRYGSPNSAGGRYGSGAWYEEPEDMDGTWHESQEDASNGTWQEGQEGASNGTWRGTQRGTGGSAWHRAHGSAANGAWYGGREEYRPYNRRGERRLRLFSRLPAWAWILFVFLIIMLVVSAVFSILAAIFPILLPILIIVFLVKAFRD